LLQLDDLKILFAPLLLTPVSILAWYLSSAFRRPHFFAWASIMQVSITIACLFFYMFGTLQQSHIAGMTAGLLSGLATALAGRKLYQKSQQR
jgi:hypothetical protein